MSQSNRLFYFYMDILTMIVFKYTLNESYQPEVAHGL